MRPEDSRISAAQIRRRNRRWTVYVMGFVLIVAASLWYKGFDSYRITPACDDLFSDKNDTGSFLAQKNGLVLDSRTGLTWYSCSAGQRFQDNECLGLSLIHISEPTRPY